MKSTVETLSPTRVRLAIEVPFAELEPSLKKAYREIGAQVNIPGFRRGKVPAAVIDQRVGRGAVLNEAVQEAIPQQILAAVREHDVKTLGRPEVEITEFADGEPLKFTAEVDVRPEITLPDLGSIEVTVDALADRRERDRRAGQRAARALRHAEDRRACRPQSGDYVQIDLAATVDGEEVPGGSATNISHEVGSKQLLPGLDEALVGLAAGDATTFTTPARRRRLRRPGRRRRGDRAHASRRRSCRSSTTSSPSWPASSTRSRSCATTCGSGSPGSSRSSSSTPPATRPWRELVAAAEVPAPGGRGQRRGRAAASRR